MAGGPQDRGEHRLRFGSALGSVAAADLPGHHGWPDGLLSPPIGGLDTGLSQEGEQRALLVSQVLEQLATQASEADKAIVAQAKAMVAFLPILADANFEDVYLRYVAK